MKTELRWATIAIIATCLFVLVEYSLGFHGRRYEIGRWTGLLALAIPAFVYTQALREKRDIYQGGRLSVLEGIRSGFLIAVLTGIATALFMAAYNRWINPDFVALGISKQQAVMEAAGETPAEIEATLDAMRTLSEPFVQLAMNFTGTTVVGTLIAAVASVFLRYPKGQRKDAPETLTADSGGTGDADA